MSDPAEQVRAGKDYIERTYGDADPECANWYANGGHIPGASTFTVIHPDECIITRELKCVRPHHKHGVTL